MLCCRAFRLSLECCVLVLCDVLSCCVLFWVALCRLVSFGVVQLAVCWAVPPGAVLGRVASCCAVWCSAAVHCAVGVVLLCVVSRCVLRLRAVPSLRAMCGALGAVCFAACCAVLCCAAVFCAVPWGGLWSGSVFLRVVLCLFVLCCAALRRVVTCGAVLLRTVLFAWGCTVFAPALWCCCVLCPVLGCCAVL